MSNRDKEDLKGYEHLTSIERDKILILRRRMLHLKTRVETSPIDLSYDKQELSALVWVLGVIANSKPETSPENQGGKVDHAEP
jgi:hypothetical protein